MTAVHHQPELDQHDPAGDDSPGRDDEARGAGGQHRLAAYDLCVEGGGGVCYMAL